MNLLQDLRHGLRALLKRPGFAVTAILTLALGIGANIAVFSIVNALILRPYPFPDLDRLVLVHAAGPNVVSEIKIAPADFLDLQRESALFQSVAAFRGNESNLTGSGDAEVVVTATVSPNFFELLGVQPFLGRQFMTEEGQSGRDAVVVLNYGFWHRRFGADPRLLGGSIEVDGRKLTVIGVMPHDFRYPEATDMWMPLVMTPGLKAERNAQAVPPPAFRVMAKLRPEVSLKQAQVEVQAFASRLQQQYPDTHRGRSLNLILLRKGQYSFSAPLFLTLQVAALFVLLLAIANLLNLLFARLVDRRKEMAVRTALGAGKMRLMQLVMGETVSLALIAGTIALLCSVFTVKLIRTSIPENYTKWIAGWELIRLDWQVIEFAIVLTLLAGVLFAVLAGWRSSRPDLNRVLKEGDRASAGQRGFFRSALVTAQIAFAAVLLSGAVLMVQGFFRLAKIYRAFDPGNVLRLEVMLPEQRYDDDIKIRTFYQQLLDHLQTLPGIQAAGIVTNAPASNVNSARTLFAIEGQTVLHENEAPSADLQSISPDFFHALRIPVLQGRSISDHDGTESPLVAVASRTMAAQFWPGKSPIGQRIRIGSGVSAASRDGTAQHWATIVGVVEDVKQNWWDNEPRPVIYRSYLQAPKRSMVFALRTAYDPLGAVAAVRAAGRSLDPNVSFLGLATMESEVSDSLAPIRILGILMVLFGAVSIALSALGIYGLLAHSVAQRRREFGIRMALGAQRQDVLRLVLSQSSQLCVVGLAIGLPLAYALVRLMGGLLYGVIVFSATVFIVLAAGLTVVALLAAYIPARRATHVDPMLALRYE